MAPTEKFQVVDGPAQHLLERALLVRDSPRKIRLTFIFDPDGEHTVEIPVSLNMLGQAGRDEHDWIIAGDVEPMHWDNIEGDVYNSILRWLWRGENLSHYRGIYNSRVRIGEIRFTDKPLVGEIHLDESLVV